MDDLISRQAAIDFIDAGHLVNPNEPRWSDNEIVNFLKSLPSAQQEIVRCKDCKYWYREIYNGVEYFNFSSCDLNHRGMEIIFTVLMQKGKKNERIHH